MADPVHHREKGIFIRRLKDALPLLRERFGVAKIGIFGSTARAGERCR